MVDSEDPYFAGQISSTSFGVKGLGPVERPPFLAWLFVYLANLVVPLYFGMMVTSGSGRYGMMFGVLVLFAMGYGVSRLSPRLMMAAVYGGWIVASSQLFPALHLFVGVMAVGAASSLGQARPHVGSDVSTELGGLIATLLTGGALLCLATLMGLVIQWVSSRRG